MGEEFIGVNITKVLCIKCYLIVCLISISITNAYAGLPQTIKKVKPSIVGVASYDPLGAPRVELKGTGFVVKNGYYVVTNFHVVAAIQVANNKHPVILVGTGNSPERRNAKLVAQSEQFDLAVLKITEGKPLPNLNISAAIPDEGTLLAFTGFPIGTVLGLYPVTHRGIISSITPVAVPANSAKGLNADVVRRLRKPFSVFQLDATAYPGNSGSPLYDPDSGKVVGVINSVFIKKSKEAVLSDPSGITYAIPSKALLQLLERLD